MRWWSPPDRADTRCRSVRRCAERYRRGDASRIGDAAGGDDRHVHRSHDLRHEREVPTWVVRSSDRNMPRCPPASRPCAMIASTPCASSHRASSTVVADESTFAPHARTAASSSARRQAEMKADDGGPEVAQDRRRLRALNGTRPGAGRHAAPFDSELLVVRRERSSPRASRCASGAGGVWQKKFTLNGRRSRRDRRQFAAHRFRGAWRTAAIPARRRWTPRAPGASLHAGHRRLNDRQLDAQQRLQSHRFEEDEPLRRCSSNHFTMAAL